MRLFLAICAAVATSLILLSSIASAASNVQITALDCESHPRRIRIENTGDSAQDLSGWQLQSDQYEGGPMDLSEVGSIPAGGKFFVFQGHLSPAQDPSAGFWRWGTDENFNLRANDSTDYVRIVDSQGNNVSQKNCEGLAPGATPVPTSIYDPPPLVQETPTPTPEPTAAPTAAQTAAPTTRATAAPQGGPARASTSASPTATTAAIASTGGPPGTNDDTLAMLMLAAGTVSLSAGFFFVVQAARRKPTA